LWHGGLLRKKEKLPQFIIRLVKCVIGAQVQKVDLKKELKHLYCPTIKEVNLVDVPQMNFVMIDGSGDPNKAKEYQEAIKALYSISYTIKFAVKKKQGIDFVVMPLEGLWWTDNMSLFTTSKDIWKWTAIIMQPEYVTLPMFKVALEQVEKKKACQPSLKLDFIVLMKVGRPR
jgi:hypothetical protein